MGKPRKFWNDTQKAAYAEHLREVHKECEYQQVQDGANEFSLRFKTMTAMERMPKDEQRPLSGPLLQFARLVIDGKIYPAMGPIAPMPKEQSLAEELGAANEEEMVPQRKQRTKRKYTRKAKTTGKGKRRKVQEIPLHSIPLPQVNSRRKPQLAKRKAAAIMLDLLREARKIRDDKIADNIVRLTVELYNT